MENTLKFRPIHPFPARMAPSIALGELPSAGRKPLKILDPMAGSGTTLVVARSLGHMTYGFDKDPLALLISDVWSSDLDGPAILETANAVFKDASQRYKRITQGQAYPIDCDEETKCFVRYWFDVTNRRQLRSLVETISTVADPAIQKALWCAFSRLIIAKVQGASLANDLSHSRPHKVEDKPTFRPIPNFLKAVKTVINNAPFNCAQKEYPKANISQGDARAIPLPDSSIDIVITSPPYLNAIDYLRCNKFSLVWMGHQIPTIRGIRSSNIGSELSTGIDESEPTIKEILAVMGNTKQLPIKNRRILARYIQDMDVVMSEIGRVLVPGGRCVLVIGDCTMRGLFIQNSKALIKLGERYGLAIQKVNVRTLMANRRYLPPPTSKQAGKFLQNRMRNEVVLSFIAAA